MRIGSKVLSKVAVYVSATILKKIIQNPQILITSIPSQKIFNMKKTFLILTLLSAMFACKNEPKGPAVIVADPNINEHATTKVFSELPFDFICETKVDSSGTETLTLKKVNIISADLKDPGFVIEIKSCEEISKDKYSEYNIPEGTDAAVKGLTIKGLDIILVVKTEKPGIAIVTRGFKDNDGEFQFGPYKKYTLNANGYKMEAQTVITSNN